MTTTDLKDAYFTVPVHQSHFKYLGFITVWTCLNVLSSIKVMKPIVAE